MHILQQLHLVDNSIGFIFELQYCCCLVSENKVLCHPSSVDSIPTNAGQEDHASMGGWSARKVLKVLDNVEICNRYEISNSR